MHRLTKYLFIAISTILALHIFACIDKRGDQKIPSLKQIPVYKSISENDTTIILPITITVLRNGKVLNKNEISLNFIKNSNEQGKNQFSFNSFTMAEQRNYKRSKYIISPFFEIENIFVESKNDSIDNEGGLFVTNIWLGTYVTKEHVSYSSKDQFSSNNLENRHRYVLTGENTTDLGFLRTFDLTIVAKNESIGDNIEWSIPKIDTSFYFNEDLEDNKKKYEVRFRSMNRKEIVINH